MAAVALSVSSVILYENRHTITPPSDADITIGYGCSGRSRRQYLLFYDGEYRVLNQRRNCLTTQPGTNWVRGIL